MTEARAFYRWGREMTWRGLSTALAGFRSTLRHLPSGSAGLPEVDLDPVLRALRTAVSDGEKRVRGSMWMERLPEALAELRMSGTAGVVAGLNRESGSFTGSLARTRLGRAWRLFTGPTDALPIDLFRVLVGLLGCAYFSRTLFEAPTFSGPNGLIDHGLVRRTLWYTRLGFFPPGAGLNFFRVVYALAAMGSLLLAAGIWVKPVSAFLYATAVSTYRRNFPVTYVDDALMHLALLWMLLLPIGNTLTLPEWHSERGAAVERWKKVRVQGAAVRCLMANLALVYIVAGLWKWTSPLWKEGLAVYAILKTAVSRTPDLWRPGHVPALRAANHTALVLEPLFPVAFVLPSKHPLKWLLGAAMFGFHAGIIATLKIPFANIACIAALVLVFREEIMAWLRGDSEDSPRSESPAGEFGLAERAACLLVAWLALAMLSEATRPYWRYGTPPVVKENRELANRTPGMGQNPFYGVLWLVGLAQSYRLFDWVDEYNYHIAYEVVERQRGGAARTLDDGALFPRTIRNVLLQSYLQDAVWMKVPRRHLPDLQRSVFERYVRRFCSRCQHDGRIEVVAKVQRTTAANLGLDRPRRVRFLEFTCGGREPRLHFMRLARS
ncbi:MAG TPA: hypothetical protein VHM69_18590 [Rubrobacter sp.]|nr:hypothetical protein [Rubrobacter sp.]